MFRSRKAKIVSTPVEEVLEVEIPVEDVWEEVIEEPVFEQVTNIETLTLDQTEDEMCWGSLTDYDGLQYSYQWDTKTNRIVRLVGNNVNKLTWDLCENVLRKFFIKPEPPKVEEKILPQVENAISSALNQITTSFKNLESKVDKALVVRAAPAPAPV